MNRWSVVTCLLVAACGKGEKAPPPPPAIDARSADAAVVIDAPAKPTAPGDAAGPGSAPTAAVAKVLEVVIADRVACARRTDGRVRCWGSPWDGRGLPVVAAPVELAGMTTAVASAYATMTKAGTTVWFTDFAVEPEADGPMLPVRGTQRAVELVLANGKKPIDRGRYTTKGPRSAKLTVHAAERYPRSLVVSTSWSSWSTRPGSAASC